MSSEGLPHISRIAGPRVGCIRCDITLADKDAPGDADGVDIQSFVNTVPGN